MSLADQTYFHSIKCRRGTCASVVGRESICITEFSLFTCQHFFLSLYGHVLFVHSGHGGHSLFVLYTGRTRLLFIEDKQVSVSAFVQLRVMAGFLVCFRFALFVFGSTGLFVFELEFVCVIERVCIVALSI